MFAGPALRRIRRPWSVSLLIAAVAGYAGAAGRADDRWLAGMRLEAQGGRVVVARILEGSPAARSGLLPGDVLLMIADRALVDLRNPSPGAIMRIVDQAGGDSVRLLVGRGSGTLGVLLPLRGPAASGSRSAATLPEPGAAAPEFEGRALDGRSVTLTALRGRPVLVDFWASWCPPCRNAALMVRRIADQYGDRLAIVGVSLDDDRRDYEAFVFNRHLPGMQIHDGGPRGPIATLYGAPSACLPFAVLIAADGTIVATGRTPADLEAAIERVAGPGGAPR